MTPEDMKARTRRFALRVMRLVDALPNTVKGQVLGRQLMRCGTSVGANYRSACRGRSRAEFAAKMGIVEEEADESGYWLELIIEANVLKQAAVEPLLAEANELLAIASASRITARKPPQSPPNPEDPSPT